MQRYSVIKKMSFQTTKRRGGTLNAHYYVEEDHLKRRCEVTENMGMGLCPLVLTV